MDSRYYPGVERNRCDLVAELRPSFDVDYEVKQCTYLQRRSCKRASRYIARDHRPVGQRSQSRSHPRPAAHASRSECRSGLTKLLWPRLRLCCRWIADCTSRARSILAIQDHRRRLEDNRRPHRAQSRRLCATDAWALRTCGAANSAGAGFVQPARQPARRSHLRRVRATQKDSSARFCNSCGKPLST